MTSNLHQSQPWQSTFILRLWTRFLWYPQVQSLTSSGLCSNCPLSAASLVILSKIAPLSLSGSLIQLPFHSQHLAPPDTYVHLFTVCFLPLEYNLLECRDLGFFRKLLHVSQQVEESLGYSWCSMYFVEWMKMWPCQTEFLLFTRNLCWEPGCPTNINIKKMEMDLKCTELLNNPS